MSILIIILYEIIAYLVIVTNGAADQSAPVGVAASRLSHVRIRHYPNVTDDHCGIGRLSTLIDDMCYKWQNQAVHLLGSSVQSGRSAQLGEAPWIVYWHYEYIPWYAVFLSTKWYCTGSILNKRWIITAAHCLYRPDKQKRKFNQPVRADPNYIQVWPGLQDWVTRSDNPYGSLDWWVHPQYYTESTGYSNPGYDIGLIKLNRDIPLRIPGQRRRGQRTAICMPDHGLRNSMLEWMYFAGWGYLDESRQNFGRVQLGTGILGIDRKIVNSKFDPSFLKENSTIVDSDPLPGQPITCEGDSGGPWWQYDQGGRAVQIGVHKAAGPKTKNGYCADAGAAKPFMTGSRVSYAMDWIVDTVRQNGMD